MTIVIWALGGFANGKTLIPFGLGDIIGENSNVFPYKRLPSNVDMRYHLERGLITYDPFLLCASSHLLENPLNLAIDMKKKKKTSHEDQLTLQIPFTFCVH